MMTGMSPDFYHPQSVYHAVMLVISTQRIRYTVKTNMRGANISLAHTGEAVSTTNIDFRSI